MKLSVVIVSFNVKYFLDQLIESILSSKTNFRYEIIVVDNNSIDGSSKYISEKYPAVKVISNSDNEGFTKANNQGAMHASGQFILLLNPDTLVDENTFQACIDFLDGHPKAGAVGVKMYDGSGTFLPESKRGFPTPWVSLTKITRLNKIFKGTKLFDQYYLGYLDQDKANKVDVLTGAFMMIRKEIYDELGGLDESYFMYGEDIDLSYQINKLGYGIYYLPSSKIIHYKGESTNKNSFKRNKDFYKSMLLFTNKNLLDNKSLIYKWWINISIFLLAILNSTVNKFSSFIHVIIEAAVLYAGIITIKNIWAQAIHGDIAYYDASFNWINAPIYTLILISSLILVGAYDEYPRWRKIAYGSILGFVAILIIYALMPNIYRSSRPILFLSLLWMILSSFVIRSMWSWFDNGNFLLLGKSDLRVLIFGEQSEVHRVRDIYEENKLGGQLYYQVINPSEDEGKLAFNLDQNILNNNYDELIICGKNLDFNFIIALMSKLKSRIKFRLLTENSSTIVSSHSSRHPGEIYTLDISYHIVDPVRRRLKRLLDFISAVILIVLFPITLWMIFRNRFTITNLMDVLRGKLSWVGYDHSDPNTYKLPKIKTGVYHIADSKDNNQLVAQAHKMNEAYARNYSILEDIKIVLSKWAL